MNTIHLNEVCSNIKGIVSDIDGVLTSGEIIYSSSGVELKSFNVKDGSSIVRLKNKGIDFALISGRESIANQLRAKELGIEHLYENISDKGTALDELINNGFPSENICAIGDDISGFISISTQLCDIENHSKRWTPEGHRRSRLRHQTQRRRGHHAGGL